MTFRNKAWPRGAPSVTLTENQAGSDPSEVRSNKTRLRGKFQKYLEQSETHLKGSTASQAEDSDYNHIVSLQISCFKNTSHITCAASWVFLSFPAALPFPPKLLFFSGP